MNKPYVFQTHALVHQPCKESRVVLRVQAAEKPRGFALARVYVSASLFGLLVSSAGMGCDVEKGLQESSAAEVCDTEGHSGQSRLEYSVSLMTAELQSENYIYLNFVLDQFTNTSTETKVRIKELSRLAKLPKRYPADSREPLSATGITNPGANSFRNEVIDQARQLWFEHVVPIFLVAYTHGGQLARELYDLYLQEGLSLMDANERKFAASDPSALYFIDGFSGMQDFIERRPAALDANTQIYVPFADDLYDLPLRFTAQSLASTDITDFLDTIGVDGFCTELFNTPFALLSPDGEGTLEESYLKVKAWIEKIPEPTLISETENGPINYMLYFQE